MQYVVSGGEYKDTTFEELIEGTEEEYGPFNTVEEADDVWRAKSWANVDKCHHFLSIRII